jgi:hypothetical protein
MFKETLIASVTAGVVIPLLWMLGAVVSPERDARSPGLDLAVLTLAGAAMVMLLRATWRTTAAPSPDGDHRPEDRNWGAGSDSYGRGQG